MPLKPARLVPAVTAAARAAGNQLINNYRKFLLAYERHHRPRDLPAPPTSEVRGHVTPRATRSSLTRHRGPLNK